MKTVDSKRSSLESCLAEAQDDRIVITREGRPVALMIGLDEEQQQLGSSDEFWKLIAERRSEKTLSRAELEERIAGME